MAEEEENVWDALGQVVDKLRAWILSCAKEQGASADLLEALRQGLDRDVGLYCVVVKDFIEKHGKAVEEKNCDYFQKMLPAQFQQFKVTPEIMAKASNYVTVFKGLFEALE